MSIDMIEYTIFITIYNKYSTIRTIYNSSFF